MKNKKNTNKTPLNTFEEELHKRRSYIEESDESDEEMTDIEDTEDYKDTNKRVSKTPSRASTSSANSNPSVGSVNLGEILRRQMGGGTPVEKMRETKKPGKLPSGSGDHLKHLGKSEKHKNSETKTPGKLPSGSGDHLKHLGKGEKRKHSETKMPSKLNASRGEILKSLHTQKAQPNKAVPSHSRSTAPAVNFGANPNGSKRNASTSIAKTIAPGIGKDAFNEIRLKMEEQLRGIASSAEVAKKLAAEAARQAEAGRAEQAAAAAKQAEAAIAEIQRQVEAASALQAQAARQADFLRNRG